jgi:selenocysteine lyase/cysteine desulfurase
MQGPEDPVDAVGILSLNVDGVPSATVSRFLDDEWGVMTRAGLHCAPAAHRSLGTAPNGSVRFSWSNDTTDDEIDSAADALRTIAARARDAEPARTTA